MASYRKTATRGLKCVLCGDLVEDPEPVIRFRDSDGRTVDEAHICLRCEATLNEYHERSKRDDI